MRKRKDSVQIAFGEWCQRCPWDYHGDYGCEEVLTGGLKRGHNESQGPVNTRRAWTPRHVVSKESGPE